MYTAASAIAQKAPRRAIKKLGMDRYRFLTNIVRNLYMLKQSKRSYFKWVSGDVPPGRSGKQSNTSDP